MSSIRSRFRKSLQACGGLTGIATVALGLVVVFGWHLGNRTLIQVLPQFVPMQYNTALGFVFSGLALTMLVIGRQKVGVVFGAIAALIGGLTLVECIGGVNLGIDELFMDHNIMVVTSNWERMAPNTVVCFTLFGLGALVRPRRWKPTHRSVLTVILGSVTFGLGAAKRFPVHVPRRAELVPPYSVGAVEMFWVIQRVAGF